jgi:hypothetical protein
MAARRCDACGGEVGGEVEARLMIRLAGDRKLFVFDSPTCIISFVLHLQGATAEERSDVMAAVIAVLDKHRTSREAR